MNDLVSVIIPTYNRPLYLDRAIKSVLNQTYKNIEIIIVDDNGDNYEIQDKTKIIIDMFNSYPNVKYIRNRFNMGGAESRNEGVKNAKGKYISFLDDDDVYDKDKISEQMKVLITNTNIDVCYCGMKYFNSEGEHIGQRDIYLEGSQELIEKHIFRPITGTPALLMKKSIFEYINGFDNLKRYQDANFIFKILAYGFNIAHVKSELVNVYIHDNERISTMGNRIELEREYIENTLKYINLISFKNSMRLIEKYHILNCLYSDKSLLKRIFNIIKIIKFKILIKNNLLAVLNYCRLILKNSKV